MCLPEGKSLKIDIVSQKTKYYKKIMKFDENSEKRFDLRQSVTFRSWTFFTICLSNRAKILS